VNGNGSPGARQGRQLIADAVAARRRAQLVSGLRGLSQTAPTQPAGTGATVQRFGECCDLCGVDIADDHRHLLQLVERRIVCACEACWAMRAGEGDYRPTGSRTLWLPDLDLPNELWAEFQIPIGLAFLMKSTVTACVVAMYPSPAGATESELHFESWDRVLARNPVLEGLESDIEGLIVNRLADPPQYAIAPIDRCYGLTGLIKASWEGISGGPRVREAVGEFFERLSAEAVTA